MSKKEKDLTESKLIELGFEKVMVSPEEAGDLFGYYYYVYELYNGNCLISDTNDTFINNLCNVEFLDMPDAGTYDNSIDVENLINAINAGKRGGL